MTQHFTEGAIAFIECPAPDIEKLEKEKAFYSAVFGWSYTDWGNDYADTKDSGIGSGINADPAHRSRHTMPVIYTKNLEAMRDKIAAANGTVTRDIFSYPGGRRFHALDPAGNEIAVCSDV